MDKFRGVLMLAAGCFAFYRGIVMHGRHHAWVVFLLGVLAIAVGIFRLTRKPAPPRLRHMAPPSPPPGPPPSS